jgi:hypothetical protein
VGVALRLPPTSSSSTSSDSGLGTLARCVLPGHNWPFVIDQEPSCTIQYQATAWDWHLPAAHLLAAAHAAAVGAALLKAMLVVAAWVLLRSIGLLSTRRCWTCRNTWWVRGALSCSTHLVQGCLPVFCTLRTLWQLPVCNVLKIVMHEHLRLCD